MIYLEIACVVLLAVCVILLAVLLTRSRETYEIRQALSSMKGEQNVLQQNDAALLARQDLLIHSMESSISKLQSQQHEDSMRTEQKLDHMRRGLAEGLERLQSDNQTQLDSIRKTVDEKLQNTLDRKLNDSFQLVSQRLEQVYKGLGEMQNLAAGVGDLKKVLSNVKTRGILGEIQLGAILEQMLSREQYDTNVATKKGSTAVVEYAIRLPGGDGNGPVWLPIDAKFPLDAYEQLLAAYDSADGMQVELAKKQLFQRVKGFARDVQMKYIDPPQTTDFAILFIPTEGLYAELIRGGMAETLQREYKVSLAGPTTMGALLNSLQMGFRTLAIQKRSGEVWRVLGAVKTEFESFASVLENTKTRLNQANDELDKLVGVRTRKIQRTLKSVESLPTEGILMESTEDNWNV